jgi:quinol monooxygenase YgiN
VVTLLLRFSILPDKLREFEQTVDWLQQPGGQQEGAEEGLLYRRWGSEKAEFMYVEVLAEGENVQAHRDSERFRTLMGAVKVLGTITQADVIEAREVRPIT